VQSIPSARPILAALVVATALGDGASRAAEPYASVAVGATWPFSRSASDAASDYHFSDQFSGGFSGEIGVGVDFGAVRSELSYSYERSQLKSYSDSSGSYAYSGGRQDSGSLLLSAYWDIPTNSRWTPYVGGGIGYGWQNQGDSSDATASYSGYSTGGFGWQAKAGVSYGLSASSDLFAEVVYRGLSGFSASDNSSNGSTTYNYASDNRLGFQIGSRWRF